MKMFTHIVQYIHNIIQKTECNSHVHFMKYEPYPLKKSGKSGKSEHVLQRKKRDRIGKNDKHICNQHTKISICFHAIYNLAVDQCIN